MPAPLPGVTCNGELGTTGVEFVAGDPAGSVGYDVTIPAGEVTTPAGEDTAPAGEDPAGAGIVG